MNNQRISISLTSTQIKDLNKVAARLKRSVPDVVRDALFLQGYIKAEEKVKRLPRGITKKKAEDNS